MKSKWISAGLIFASAIFALMIIQHFPFQLDLTAERSYTLSKGSKALIKKIEEPISLDFYYSSSIDGVPNSFKNFARRIEVFLKQYERHSKGMIRLRIIDPKPDTKEEEQAVRLGIQSNTLPNGDHLFLGLVALQADQEESINLFSQQREAYLEYDISQLITKVQTLHLPKLGILTSLPMAGMPQQSMYPGMPPQRNQNEWVILQQLKERFDVVMLDANAQELDSSIDLLFMVHPMGLSDQLLFDVDQFLLEGNPVIAAIDPSSVVQKQSMNQQQMMMGGGAPTHSDLPVLFEGWGIEYDAMSVVGDLQYAARVSGGMGNAIPYPVWQMTTNLNKEVPVVAPLNNMLLVESGSFRLKEGNELELIPFVETSRSAAKLPGAMLMYSQPAQVMRQIQGLVDQQKGEVMTLAGIIRGDFETAFPEGLPKSVSEEVDSEEIPEKNDKQENVIKSGSGQLVLIADTDFLFDQFSVERMNFLGSTMLNPLNDNMNFVLNVTEFLSGSEDLLSLRGRGTATRPFEKVMQLEMRAQARFQSELDAVNSKLNEVQTQLSDIQSQQSSNGVLVASPELQDAIEKFQDEQANAIAKRRDIRKRLREDIESLDRNLAMLNLLFVPIILSIFGIRFFVIRNRRKQ